MRVDVFRQFVDRFDVAGVFSGQCGKLFLLHRGESDLIVMCEHNDLFPAVEKRITSVSLCITFVCVLVFPISVTFFIDEKLPNPNTPFVRIMAPFVDVVHF